MHAEHLTTTLVNIMACSDAAHRIIRHFFRYNYADLLCCPTWSDSNYEYQSSLST
jgi:hypothetical protein